MRQEKDTTHELTSYGNKTKEFESELDGITAELSAVEDKLTILECTRKRLVQTDSLPTKSSPSSKN